MDADIPSTPSPSGSLAPADITEISNWGAENSVELENVIGRLIKSVSSPSISFAGLSLDHPILMGVLNITPDSFHDGGRFANHDLAIAHAIKLLNSGAEILDIGENLPVRGQIQYQSRKKLIASLL